MQYRDLKNKAKKLGFQQTMWLDAVEKKYVEELSGMNVFAVVNNKIYTPLATLKLLFSRGERWFYYKYVISQGVYCSKYGIK